ncbi:MAG: DUF664 domain-containing protein [Nocardioides sp.]
MSNDQRVARNPGEPAKQGPAGTERWIGYLDWVRADVVDAVLTLPEPERRTTRLPSGWTPIELLSHVLHMEQRWFVWGFLGEPVEAPWGDWSREEPWDTEGPPARWQVPGDVTAEVLAARVEGIAERTRTVLREHAPDTPASPGGRFAEDPPTLDWICFHVLTEYARHAGHLDIAVELAL